MDGEPMKVCIVSSCGGHLTEVRALRGAYARYPHHYVLNDYAELPDDMRDCTRFISHSERDWRFFVNLWEAASILRRERPEVLLSTGAGPIVPFALVARFFFPRVRIVYIETLTRVTRPSMTGRIMYHLTRDFYYQWPQLAPWFPRAKCGGLVL
jgi:beta-1,4-N-acetylglucosaminyltransferase